MNWQNPRRKEQMVPTVGHLNIAKISDTCSFSESTQPFFCRIIENTRSSTRCGKHLYASGDASLISVTNCSSAHDYIKCIRIEIKLSLK